MREYPPLSETGFVFIAVDVERCRKTGEFVVNQDGSEIFRTESERKAKAKMKEVLDGFGLRTGV